jgi:hypothetical protein
MGRVAALVLVLLGTLCASGQSFDASQWQQGVTVLDAPWRLHFGDDPAYAQPGFDDSHWTLHRIDRDWASAGRKGYSGYAWYRMRVILPKGNEPLAIAIYPPANAVEVDIDGALAGTIGRMRPKPVWTFLRDVYAIAVPAALHGRSVEVALRVWESPLVTPYLGAGAASHPPLIGTWLAAAKVEPSRIKDLMRLLGCAKRAFFEPILYEDHTHIGRSHIAEFGTNVQVDQTAIC